MFLNDVVVGRLVVVSIDQVVCVVIILVVVVILMALSIPLVVDDVMIITIIIVAILLLIRLRLLLRYLSSEELLLFLILFFTLRICVLHSLDPLCAVVFFIFVRIHGYLFLRIVFFFLYLISIFSSCFMVAGSGLLRQVTLLHGLGTG